MEYYFVLLVGVFFVGYLYYLYHRVEEVLDALWQEISARFGVPMTEMTFDGRKKVEFPFLQGTLLVSYPLSFLEQTGKGQNTHLATTTCKGLDLPVWFAYSTRTNSNKGFLGKLISKSSSSLNCAGVDLSDHILLVFQAIFEEQAPAVQGLMSFNSNIRSGNAMFDSTYDINTSLHLVVDHIDQFALAVECIDQRLPKDWASMFTKILAYNENPDLFETLATKLDLKHNQANRTLLAEQSSKATSKAMALWCTNGLFEIVRDASVSAHKRREVFTYWAMDSTLADRAMAREKGREIIEYFCEHETLESLSISTLERTPQLALPLMMHFFREEPEHVWEVSKKLIALMQADEARAWLDHLEDAGYAITPEHLVCMRLSDDMHTSMAQDLMSHIQTMASAHPSMMKNKQLNQNIAHLLMHVGQDAFSKACEWLTRSGTKATMQSLSPLVDHFPRRSSQGKKIEHVLDHLSQRVGRAGGLSLSADVQAGGLSVSAQAQQGDVTFVFDEVEDTASQKKRD